MKLRLLLFEECNRSCKGCCNKDWDLNALEKCKTFSGYDEIMLTGGEPMLDLWKIIDTVSAVRRENKEAKIILYTAKTDKPLDLLAILHYIDGITITLHDQKDVPTFQRFNNMLAQNRPDISYRANIFKGIKIENLPQWQTKRNIEWMKNCPLPEGEVFQKL